MVIFSLLKRKTSVVVYIACETLWTNFMNETVPTIPGIGYRCHELITDGKAFFFYIIPGSSNPTDASTKANPNLKLAEVLKTNKCATPCKCVFMLQISLFRHVNCIATNRFLMSIDVTINPDQLETC